MNKRHTKTLLGFLAATALLCGAFLTTGCNTLQKAQDEYPIAYDLLKGGAEVALTYYLGTTTDTFVVQNREALMAATRDVFAENEDPRNVALALSREIEEIYPDDPATRDAIMRNLAVVLRSDPDTPASGPNAGAQSEYNADLADALDPGGTPQANAAPSSTYRELRYEMSLRRARLGEKAEPEYTETWPTPAWAKWKYGDHWSDGIIGFVLGPFGVEDYAGLRGYHSYGLTQEEEVAFAEWQEDARNLRALAAATDPETGNINHEAYRQFAD